MEWKVNDWAWIIAIGLSLIFESFYETNLLKFVATLFIIRGCLGIFYSIYKLKSIKVKK